MARPAKTSKNTIDTVCAIVDQCTNHGDRILDLPCGTGVLCEKLKTNSKQFSIFAGDILDINKTSDVNFRIVDMNKPLPFEDKFFDIVVCGDGLAHLKRPFDFVEAVHRLLKDDGLVCISTPNLSSLRSRWRFFTTGFHNKRKVPFDEKNVHPEHIINALDFPDLRYLFCSNGFKIELITTNRCKLSTWIYSIFLPLVFIMSLYSFIKEGAQRNRSGEDRKLYKAVFKQMLQREVLFGETLILSFRKV